MSWFKIKHISKSAIYIFLTLGKFFTFNFSVAATSLFLGTIFAFFGVKSGNFLHF